MLQEHPRCFFVGCKSPGFYVSSRQFSKSSPLDNMAAKYISAGNMLNRHFDRDTGGQCTFSGAG